MNRATKLLPGRAVVAEGAAKRRLTLDFGGFNLKERQHAADEIDIIPYGQHFLTLYISHPLNLFQVRGAKARREFLTPGDLTLDPAYERSLWRWDEPCHVFHVNLLFSFVRDVAQEAEIPVERTELRDLLHIRDPKIRQWMILFREELHTRLFSGDAGADIGGKLYGESLAVALTIHLLRQHSLDLPRIREYEGGLTPRQLRGALDFLSANLTRGISLREVAQAVGLSPYHFARLFKQSAGQTPHQYHLTKRVERARLLLLSTSLTIGEVAEEMGFSHASHFARHCRRILGVAPGDFKRARAISRNFLPEPQERDGNPPS